MVSADDLCSLIQKGGVFKDVEGTSVSEILSSAVSLMKLPAGLSSDLLKTELIERENILSTAVGNGIALPHPHRKIIDASDDQLMVTVKQRHRSIVGKCEDNSSAARIVSHAGISLLNAVADIKDTHSACM